MLHRVSHHSTLLHVPNPADLTLEQLESNRDERERLLRLRDALIVTAWGQGVPVTRIAERVGLDRTQIHRIVKDPWIVAREADLQILSVWRTRQEAETASAQAMEPTYVRQVGIDEKGQMTPDPSRT